MREANKQISKKWVLIIPIVVVFLLPVFLRMQPKSQTQVNTTLFERLTPELPEWTQGPIEKTITETTEPDNQKNISAKTITTKTSSNPFWDWLTVLATPFTLAILVPFVQWNFNVQLKKRDEREDLKKQESEDIENKEQLLEDYQRKVSELLDQPDKNVIEIQERTVNLFIRLTRKVQTNEKEAQVHRESDNDEDFKRRAIRHLISKQIIDKIEFHNINLSDANLSDLDLRNAKFKKANLSNANLVGADLRGANLSEANLNGAKLNDYPHTSSKARGNPTRLNEETKISGANFKGANLFYVDFSQVKNFETIDFSEAALMNADFSQRNLFGVNFSGADLRCANFFGAHLGEEDDDIDDMNIIRPTAKLKDANLYDTDFRNASLCGVDFSNCFIAETKLDGANLAWTKFKTNKSSKGAIIVGTDLRYIQRFHGSYIFNAKRSDEDLESEYIKSKFGFDSFTRRTGELGPSILVNSPFSLDAGDLKKNDSGNLILNHPRDKSRFKEPMILRDDEIYWGRSDTVKKYREYCDSPQGFIDAIKKRRMVTHILRELKKSNHLLLGIFNPRNEIRSLLDKELINKERSLS